MWSVVARKYQRWPGAHATPVACVDSTGETMKAPLPYSPWRRSEIQSEQAPRARQIRACSTADGRKGCATIRAKFGDARELLDHLDESEPEHRDKLQPIVAYKVTAQLFMRALAGQFEIRQRNP